jgi:HPt (histidine-containing phosphotransfer) domain-containing protein
LTWLTTLEGVLVFESIEEGRNTESTPNTMSTITRNCQKTFDRQELLQRCLGIDSFANKLLSALASSLPVDRLQLRTALDQGDYATIARGAHRLRGSASNLCAAPLLNASTALEEAAKEGSKTDITDRWNDMEIAIDEILRALEAEGIV